MYTFVHTYQTYNLYVIKICVKVVEYDNSILRVYDVHNLLHDHDEFSLYANCTVKIVRIELRTSIKRARPAKT